MSRTSIVAKIPELRNSLGKLVGSGRGGFIELPEFQAMPDSVLVKIPAYSTIYGRVNDISMVDISGKNAKKKFMEQFRYAEEHKSPIRKIITEEEPCNIILSNITNTKNQLQNVNIDDYDNGIIIPRLYNNILYYSGDLSVNEEEKRISGYGVIVLKVNKGINKKKELEIDESICIRRDSILAFDTNVKILPYEFKRTYIERLLGNLFKWESDYCQVKGPGQIYLNE